jgi:hypothetical protein
VLAPVDAGGFVYFHDSLDDRVYRVSKDGSVGPDSLGTVRDTRGSNLLQFGNDTQLFYPAADGLGAIGYDGTPPYVVVTLNPTHFAGDADSTTAYVVAGVFLVAITL